MDARSLLRAKKAEARIQHPFASYSAAGQLRCSICALPVKQWDAHLLTKQHRQSVLREKEVQAKTKRPATETLAPESKRPKVAESTSEAASGSRSSILPAGFFSAGNRPVALDEDDVDEDEEEETEVKAGPSKAAAASAAPVAPAPTGDSELDDFLSSLADPEPETTAPATTLPPSGKAPAKRYLSDNGPAGVASYEAAPVRILPKGEEEAVQEEEVEPEETEEERRKRIEQDEKEEIMGRLEEEERAQEDADSRVLALKARMEMLKKRREGRPTKTKSKVDAKHEAGTNGA